VCCQIEPPLSNTKVNDGVGTPDTIIINFTLFNNSIKNIIYYCECKHWNKDASQHTALLQLNNLSQSLQ